MCDISCEKKCRVCRANEGNGLFVTLQREPDYLSAHGHGAAKAHHTALEEVPLEVCMMSFASSEPLHRQVVWRESCFARIEIEGLEFPASPHSFDPPPFALHLNQISPNKHFSCAA
jgi:hypothetical protein